MTEAAAEPLTETVEHLTKHVTEYAETYVELAAVSATQKAAEVASISFTAVLASFFGMIIMIFLGLGLAELFSESMAPKTGYFLVTLIYAVLGAVLLGFRKQLIFPMLRNKIISKMYEGKDTNV